MLLQYNVPTRTTEACRKMSSLQGLQECRYFLLKPRAEVAMENAVKYLVKFCCSSFLRKRSSEVPRTLHDYFQLQMPNFMAVFTLQTFVLEKWRSPKASHVKSVSRVFRVFVSAFSAFLCSHRIGANPEKTRFSKFPGPD